ncbi:TonB-dependent receptor [Massilia sp. TW-1]|uniref:TonB-dependent receptor n=1 Tax=Telluria antibiotica TaxID=2717319 RepID=A0ABX0PIH4_9BURK|nr:TonB-dependent receptor [Telluria antibiotica]NIA57233.1 TonB-dependent receptor [Telluria antibiotica]
MTFKLKSMPFAVSCAIASGALFAAPAMAQTQDAVSAQAPQRVVVTGSLISRTDTETPTPVQVLTAQDIQKSGKTSVAELLNDLAANGQGTLGTGFSGAFANGASGISLRGLTVGATLVLVDGHRLAPYPLSDDAQRSFVDVSSIPFDAIERIEVLKSGASSLYGSDAIAGVVNIILKKNLTGTRLAAESGNTQHGGGRTHRASVSTGIGDLDNDGYNAFVTAEWRRQGAIKVSDRDQFSWANADWRSRGGNNIRLGVPNSLNSRLVATNSPFLYNPAGAPLPGVNPATGKPWGVADNPANFQFLDPSKCNYNLYMSGGCAIRDTVTNIQPQTENINLMVGLTKKLSEDWELAFKGSMFQRNSINNRGSYLSAYSPTTFGGNNSLNNGVVTSGNSRVPSTLIPATATFNQLGAPARLYGYIPGTDPFATQDNTATTTRFALDLHGTAYGWDTRIAGGVTKVKTDIDYSGYINRAALYNAIFNGTWNPVGGNSPDLLAQVSPHFSNTLESKLNYLDAFGSRELMPLGAGPLVLAVGAHYHKRTQNSPAASLTANGQVAQTTAFVIGDETNSAVFAELQATPIKSLELHASGRYDHYKNFNKFTPAASFKWTQSSMFGLRGTYAKGFRAPNPAEVGNAGSFFTFNGIDDPKLCKGGDPNAKDNVPTACGLNPPYVQLTTPSLQPEKSTSYTLGMILEPVRGLNATLDYYNIKVTNQIVSAAGNDPTYVPAFVRGPITPVDISNGDGTTHVGLPSDGPIIYATSPYVNLGGTKTSGIEADVGYRWRLPGDFGALRVNVSAAHTFSYITDAAGGVSYQLAGTQGPSAVSGATGSPKDRAQFSLAWSRGPLDVNTTVNYTSSFSTIDPSLEVNDCSGKGGTSFNVGGRNYFRNLPQPDYYCHVASFTAVNLNLQYKLSPNLTLKGSILNLFDRQPPADVATYGNSGAQTSYNASLHQAGAVGRFFSAGLSYTF